MTGLPDTLRRALSDRGVDRLDTLVVLGSGMSGCFGDAELDVLYGPDEGNVVAGHRGVIALLNNRTTSVLISLGRRHLYEGLSAEQVTRTVRAAAALGARNLVLTNAAGGLNPLFRVGDVMLITEALGAMPGRRGVAFDRHRYAEIEQNASKSEISLKIGVYASVLGPNYETRAEIRMLRRMGADAVGMSTLAEAAAGSQAGMTIAGISLITNVLSEIPLGTLGHGEVLKQGEAGAAKIRLVVEAFLGESLFR